MKRFFCFAAVLALSVATSAQPPLYRAEYTDSLRVPKDSAMVASIKNAEGSENIPEEIRDQLFNTILDKLCNQRLRLLVTVYADSSVIEMEQETEEGGLNLSINNKRRVWHRNAGFTDQPDSARQMPPVYQSTGRSKSLLGHSCSEYVSEDGSSTLWVATDLPSGIHPGTPAAGLQGAVLESILTSPKGGCAHALITKLQRAGQ